MGVVDGQPVEHIPDHRVVDPVGVDGPPEALEGLVLAAPAEVLVDDLEVEDQVVSDPVPVLVGQDEAAEVIGVDDGVIPPAADRRQREPGDLMVPDQLGLGIDGDGVAPEDFSIPGECEVELVAAEGHGAHGRCMHGAFQVMERGRTRTRPVLTGLAANRGERTRSGRGDRADHGPRDVFFVTRICQR